MAIRTRAKLAIPAVVGILVTWATVPALAQVTKEYIRLGGRVIAIETTGSGAPGGSISFSPSQPAAIFPGSGGQGSVTLTNTFANWSVAGSNGIQFAVQQAGSCASTTPSSSPLSGSQSSVVLCYWVPMASAPNATVGGSVAQTPALTASGCTTLSAGACPSGSQTALFSAAQNYASISVSDAYALMNITPIAGSASNPMTVTVSNAGTNWQIAPGLPTWVHAGINAGGQLTVYLDGNSGSAPRPVPTISIQGSGGSPFLSIPVNQLGVGGSPTCTVTITNNGPSALPGAGYLGSSGLVTVTASSAPTATSDSPWLTVTSVVGGSGSWNFTYSATPNSSGAQRNGKITVNVCGTSWPVPIVQSKPLVLSISPSVSYPTGGELVNYLVAADGWVLTDQTVVTTWTDPSSLLYYGTAGSGHCAQPSNACYPTPFSGVSSPFTIMATWGSLQASTVLNPPPIAPTATITLMQIEQPSGTAIWVGRSGTLRVQFVMTGANTSASPRLYVAVGPTPNGIDHGCLIYWQAGSPSSTTAASGADLTLGNSDGQGSGQVGLWFPASSAVPLVGNECTLDLRNTAITSDYFPGSQNVTYTITIPVQFNQPIGANPGMAIGPAYFGASSPLTGQGWSNFGQRTFDVSAPNPPTASVTMATQNAIVGTTDTFTVVTAAGNGTSSATINGVDLNITDANATPQQSCSIHYTPGGATPVQLWNDLHTGYVSGTPSNTQCSLSSITTNSTSGFSVAIMFTSGFIGGRLVTVTATDTTGNIGSQTAGIQINNPPNFGLTATNVTITAGTSGTSTVTIVPSNGFNSTVSLSAQNWQPAGITTTSLPASATTSLPVTINVGPNVAVGTHSLVVSGTSGSLTASATITLTVNAAPTVTVTPSPVSMSAGQAQQFTATVTGGSGTPTWTLTPSTGWGTLNTYTGSTVTYMAPSPVSSSQTVTITATIPGSVSVPATVNLTPLLSQTINFTQPADTPMSAGTVALVASAIPSNLTVTFTSTTPLICTVANATASLIGVGTCTIRADQGGNSAYAPAAPVIKSFNVQGSSSGACGNGFLYCRTMTLNHSQAGLSDSTNFPAVLASTYSWMATTANGGHVNNTVAQSGGGASIAVPADLIFATDSTCSALLSWEFESYSATTGAAVAWVKVPTLSHSVDTVIYACYGKGSATTWQGNVNGTWDASFKAVYHMNNAVTTGGQTITDSTSSANSLTTAVVSTSTLASIQGKINKAVHFIPANQYNGASAISSNVSGVGTGAVTLEMWVNAVTPISIDSESGQDIGIFNTTGSSTPSGEFVMVGASAAGNVNLIEGVADNNNYSTYALGGQAATGNTWYHVVLTYDGVSSTKLYINGASAGSYSGAWTRNDGPINISPYSTGYGYRYVDFALEEFRVSSVGRSADWVTAAYNNQSSPAGFVTAGSEVGGQLSQLINFTQPADTALSAGTVALVASASSGLTVTFTSATPLICTVTGTTATLAAVGVCTIHADQLGNSGYLPAPTVTKSFNVQASSSGSCGNGYQYCRTLTLNHSQTGLSDSTNFPAVLASTYSWMATTANGGHVSNTVTQSGGGASIAVPADLIFTSDSTCSALLSWEFESYSATNGAAVAWVKIPTLSHSADTVIYACYGKGSATTWQGNVNGTWDASFKAVYHMNNAVTMGGQTITDSTSSANFLTTAVVSTSTLASIQGKINKAVHFIPANQYNGASATSSNVSGVGTGAVTLEMWVNAVTPISIDSASGQDVGIFNPTGSSSPSGEFVMVGASAAGNVNLIEGVVDTNNYNSFALGGQTAAGNTWYHVVLAYDGSANTKLYINGASAGSYSGAWTRNDGPISISPYNTGYGYRYVDFAVEEFRVSAVGRSADWVTAAYNNQSSPAGFVTVGSETTSQTTVCGNGYQNCRTLTLNHSQAGLSDSTNFPAVLASTYSWMATTANGGHVNNTVTQSGGGASIAVPADLIFATDSTCSALLSWEFESYLATTGAAVVWVKVPTLSHSADTVIYACYGKGSATTWQGNVNGTWDASFKAVYHMNNAVTMGGQTITDSTSSANSLTTAVVSTSALASIQGKINKAVHFIPANQYNGASATSSNVSGVGTGAVTLEMWVNAVTPIAIDSTSGQDVGIFNPTGSSSPSGEFVMVGASAAGNVNLIEGVVDTNNYNSFALGGQTATGNTWYHVVLAYDGSTNTKLYINGASAGSYSGAWTRNDGPISISPYNTGYGYRYVDFAVEEFRVSSVGRSADWVTAAYNNQNSPTGFVTAGSELH